MFIRLYNTEGLLELVSSTSYGHLIQEFLALAKTNPHGYNYAQIGDIEPKKDDPSLYSAWLTDKTSSRLGEIKELIITHPVLPDRQDRWFATFTLKRPDITEDEQEGRLMSTSTVRSVSMIDAWALNEFMRQPVIKVAETPPPRHVRRQAEREKRKIPKVSTVYLRRLYLKESEGADKKSKTAPESEPRHIEWNFQWLVGMHYRQQWYPSEQTHKRILILPYWKGDESKPIKPPGEKVYKVMR